MRSYTTRSRFAVCASIAALCATAVSWAPSAHAQATALTTLYSFGSASGDGTSPMSELVQGSDGNFYGTTEFGGTAFKGTVFKMTPAGVMTTLHTFSATTSGVNSDGASPWAGLVQGSDGNFYGTTTSGGSAGGGTVFKITPAGVLTTLYSFGSAVGDGTTPYAGLVQGSDGNFYGTTYGGGTSTHPRGTVFKITPAGVLTTLYSFGDDSRQGSPQAGLVQGSDGNFYGTTTGTSILSAGTVFKITPTGALTTLYIFSAPPTNGINSDGAIPYARLLQGADGNLYGITTRGGAAGNGTVFKITPAGALTSLYSFTATTSSKNTDGTMPEAGLVQGSDGNLYGTTWAGGSAQLGTVFEIAPTGGMLTTLHFFNDNVNGDGGHPLAALVLGSDGKFYGTTNVGGASGGGTIFKLSVNPAALPTVTISASPTTINAGESSTLTWSSTNATSCTASGDWSGSKPTSGNTAVTPSTTSTYILSCTEGSAIATESVQVTVIQPTPSVTISANPTTINAGESSTLTWSSTNATSCTASGAWSGNEPTSGSLSVIPSTTSNYILTCTDGSTSVDAVTTVAVNSSSGGATGGGGGGGSLGWLSLLWLIGFGSVRAGARRYTLQKGPFNTSSD